MGKRSWTDEELQAAVQTSSSLTEVLTKLNLRAAGGAHTHIKKHIKRLNLDISHYELIYKERRDNLLRDRSSKTYEEIFCEGSKVSRSTVKNYLLRHSIIPYVCSNCSCSSYEQKDQLWHFNAKPLILTVEHKNGIPNDNRLPNLCWLCPNCHSQTDTFAGRNTDTAKKTANKLNAGSFIIAPFILSEINCQFCDKLFKPARRDIKFCSPDCAHRASAKAKYKISKEELAKLVTEHPLTEIGKMYDVTSNTVKKWCVEYDIPTFGRGHWSKLRAEIQNQELHVDTLQPPPA